jgi:predicted AAA+ superfamily ATPase
MHGGLPPFFLSEEYPEREFQDWVDSYWAKDIQELFRLERHASFQRFIELLFARSGSIFEATKYAIPCEISRTTVSNYLAVLETTYIMHVIRPFSTHRATEIVSAPKVYAFDTGFVFYYKGWKQLRTEDRGLLWEHYVLNELAARLQSRNIRYWRDKQHHEIDFVIQNNNRQPIAIECKWSANDTEIPGLQAFRNHYPLGANYVVAHDVDRAYRLRKGKLLLEFLNLEELISRL